MSDTTDGTTADTTADTTGSETTPEQKPSPEQDPIALARKRQAGAEAARSQAEAQLKDALARIEKYEAANRTKEDQETADIAKLQERLAAAERKAEEAEANANARILDAKYPNARAELPEVTDEVRLAKFEALLAEDPSAVEKEPPTPQNPNETNRAASGTAGSKPAEETSDDIKARLRTMKPDWLP